MTLYSYYIENRKKIINKSINKVILYNIINVISTKVSLEIMSYIPTIKYIENIHWSFKIILSLFIAEFWFYYSHRILHSNILYKYIHKKHHEFIKPYSLSALYSHPLEIFFNIIPSASLGPILFNITGFSLFFWIFIISFNTSSSHSGIILWPIITDSHDKHHFYFNVNYGFLGILDYLHKTNFKNNVI